MFKPKVLLIDTNVWISYYLGVEREAEEIMRLFMRMDQLGGTLAYAPTTLKDVFYIVSRRVRTQLLSAGEDISNKSFASVGWACVRNMTEVATAAPLSLPECDLAWMLRTRHGDFEDNLVIAAAETCNADYVVTYDKELLERFAPACITPSQALRLLETPRKETG